MWLQRDFIYPPSVLAEITNNVKSKPVKSSSVSSSVVQIYKGKKPYADCSSRKRLKRVRSLVDNFSLNELIHATMLSLKCHGMHGKSRILRYLQKNGDNSRFKSFSEKVHLTRPKMFTTEAALNVVISANLSKNQYITIRNRSIEYKHTQWPSYTKVSREKRKCYPEKNSIRI